MSTKPLVGNQTQEWANAVQKAVNALPDEDPKEIAGCINADGTVDPYVFPFIPEYMHANGVRVRNLVAAALQTDEQTKQ